MGDLHNIWRSIASACCAATLLLGAPTALAEDGPSRAPASIAPPTAADDAPVSMPPSAEGERVAGTALASVPGATRPLTRAAARERIDHMSPRDWLANYGQVVVGRRD